MRLAAAAILASLAWPAGSAHAASPCLQFESRALEVCTAYVVNATLAARVPYYELGRDPNPARARAARLRLESRYVGPARLALERQVARWPRGRPDVDLPRVSIVAVAISGNLARLTTVESWRVTKGTRVLFSERGRRHVAVLRRVPGLVLHKWVVSSLG